MGLFSSKSEPPPPPQRRTVEKKDEGLKNIEALEKAIVDKDQERKALSFYRHTVQEEKIVEVDKREQEEIAKREQEQREQKEKEEQARIERELQLKREREEQERKEREEQERKEREEKERKEREENERKERERKEREYQAKLLKATILAQKLWKGLKAQRAFRRLKTSAVVLQSSLRTFFERKIFIRKQKVIRRVQATYKSRLLTKKTKEQLRRVHQYKNIVFEIEATEKSYANHLKLCIDIFITPLLKTNPPIIPEEDVKSIFGNIEQIYNIHKKLGASLTKRINKWWPWQTIGSVFIKYVPQFGEEETYTAFIKNYNNAVRTYNRCLEIPSFEQFLETQHKLPQLNLLNVPDFLIMPVQRLPRYELLLNDYLKHLKLFGINHQDLSKVQSALTKLKETTQAINLKKKKSDSIERMHDVSKKIKGGKLNVIEEGRMLIKEGLLTQLKLKSGKEKEIYVFLFSDQIMISKQKSVRKQNRNTMRFEYEVSFPLSSCTIEHEYAIPAVPFTRRTSSSSLIQIDTCFVVKTKELGKEYVWKTNTMTEKKSWIAELQLAIQEAKSKLTSNEVELPHV